jgi:gluconokinase
METNGPSATPPRSGYDTTNRICYFPRMLDKIRLHARGALAAGYHAHLGLDRGGDGMCCAFLGVPYAEVQARTLEGGTDEEILAWCLARSGRKLAAIDVMLWNEFGRKLGWNDRATPFLQKQKAESGLGERDDIVTMFDFMDVDEGRKP